MSSIQRDGSPTAGAVSFSSKQLLSVLTRLSGPSWQTHYLSENLVEPGIEPGHLDL
jgi:hypothetical protein